MSSPVGNRDELRTLLATRARHLAEQDKVAGDLRQSIEHFVERVDSTRKLAARAFAGMACLSPASQNALASTQRIQIVAPGGTKAEAPFLVQTQTVTDVWKHDHRFNCKARTIASSSEAQEATIVAFEYGAGGSIPPHYHDEEELATVISGVFRDDVNGVVLGPGDSAVYPPKSVHSFFSAEGGVLVARWSPPMATKPNGEVLVRRVHVVAAPASLTA